MSTRRTFAEVDTQVPGGIPAEMAARTVGKSGSNILHLNLRARYFDEIRDLKKTEEFRLENAYWTKRLKGREYDAVVLLRGYPKAGGIEGKSRLTRKWRGVEIWKLRHEHFGPDEVSVFAIDVSVPALDLAP